MMMEIFEFTVSAKKKTVAGFNDLDKAKDYAVKLAETEHCDVDVINAFTGEVHLSLVCYKWIKYNDVDEALDFIYDVKVEWDA